MHIYWLLSVYRNTAKALISVFKLQNFLHGTVSRRLNGVPSFWKVSKYLLIRGVKQFIVVLPSVLLLYEGFHCNGRDVWSIFNENYISNVCHLRSLLFLFYCIVTYEGGFIWKNPFSTQLQPDYTIRMLLFCQIHSIT